MLFLTYKVFLTNTWGFGPELDPTWGFNTKAGRNKFLRESEPGDWVICAGTRNAPTASHERGRLLGMVQLGVLEIRVLEVLCALELEIPPEHFDENGQYRWQWGLPILNAVRFVDPPDTNKLFGSYLNGFRWVSFALNIAENVGAHAPRLIEALPQQQVSFAELPANFDQRALQASILLSRRASTGPGPSTERSASSREAGAGFAYVFQLEGVRSRDVFKVGYSKDVDQRVRDLNKGLLKAVTGYSWKPIMRQAFATEDQAFTFEQEMHDALKPHLVAGEREVYRLRKGSLETKWMELLTRGAWQEA